MKREEILDLLRNKLTLPRALLQLMGSLNSQYNLGMDNIDQLIKEIERDHDETTDK